MSKLKKFLGVFGPGFVIAATGVGAGDMVAATVAGSTFGTAIIWAVIIGAVFKFVLNEGVARWQLITGKTLLQGWIAHMHLVFSIYFIIYLVLWSFIVAGALMSACGLAAHSIFPSLSISTWGMIHSILALFMIFLGKYSFLENVMKVFISLLFVTIFANLFLMDIKWAEILESAFIPKVPSGSVGFILGLIGGVGGSVTLMSYGYWLNEKGWSGVESLKRSRLDLGFAYLFTGLFGIAVVILSSEVRPDQVSGNQIVISLAEKIASTTGQTGKWIFLLGFWGAVFSSMLGVWSGIPYLFQDFVSSLNEKTKISTLNNISKSRLYHGFLLYLAIPPMLLLFLDRPVWVIIIYSIAGAFFMPFLAGTLLYLNNKLQFLSKYKNDIISNLLLAMTFLLFLYLLINKLIN